uniref:Uncharacterized protein n=1 Tax=Anguilla anguilla TaxID=7936 RepID=A0A0E9ULQ0_ANGAN
MDLCGSLYKMHASKPDIFSQQRADHNPPHCILTRTTPTKLTP